MRGGLFWLEHSMCDEKNLLNLGTDTEFCYQAFIRFDDDRPDFNVLDFKLLSIENEKENVFICCDSSDDMIMPVDERRLWIDRDQYMSARDRYMSTSQLKGFLSLIYLRYLRSNNKSSSHVSQNLLNIFNSRILQVSEEKIIEIKNFICDEIIWNEDFQIELLIDFENKFACDLACYSP